MGREQSYVAKSANKKWIDAIVYDKEGKELQIQHKEIIWDVKYDKIRNNITNKIVKKLRETLSNERLFELDVHLNFYQKKIISSDKDIDEFCFWVTELINQN